MKNVVAVYARPNGYDILAEIPNSSDTGARVLIYLKKSENGDFYDVGTAHPVKLRRYQNKKPLWERTHLAQNRSDFEVPESTSDTKADKGDTARNGRFGKEKTGPVTGGPEARNVPSAAFREFAERMPIWTELGESAPDMDIASDLAAAFGYEVAPEHPDVAEALKKLFARGDSDAALAQILNAYAKSAIARAKFAAERKKSGVEQENAAAAPNPLALLVEAANGCGDFGAPSGEQIDEPAQDETDAPGGIPHADADAIPGRGSVFKTLRSALLRNQPQLDALRGSAHDLGLSARAVARVLRGKKSLADVDETARALFEAAQRFDGDAKTFSDWIAHYAAQARAAKKRGETVSARTLADAAFAFAAGARNGDFSGYEAVRTQVEEEELSEAEKNLVRAVSRVNAMTGGNVRIAFFDGSFNDRAQGWIDKDDVIHVNRNAPEGLLKTLGHEFTHSLEANKGYAALKKEILRADGACVGILLARTGFKSLDAYGAAVKRLYERELGRTFSDEEISREIFADVCGAALFERDAAALFAVRRQDRTLFARLLDFLKKLLPASRGTKLEREIRDAIRRYRDVMFEEKVKEEGLKLKENEEVISANGESAGGRAETPEEGEKPSSDKHDSGTRPDDGEESTDSEQLPAAGSPLSAVSALRDPQGIFYAYAREAGLNYKFPGQYPDFRGVLERVAAKRGVPVGTVLAEAEGLLRFAAANPQFSATENGQRETENAEINPDSGETNAAWSALTPSAEKAVRISGEYRVVDLSELHFVDTSDKAQQDEQERNRSGRRTREQVGRMLMNFEGERLTDDRHTDRGAPIYRVLEDGTLRSVSGEGRSRLLKEVYEHGGDPEAQYRARVEKFAREHGIEIPDGVKRPVLLRVATDTGGLSWAQLAKASNADMKSAYSEAEEAHADAREIPKIIRLLSVRSDENILDDTAFVLAFNEAVGAGTQYAQDRKEGFRETLGLRIENALVAYVLGDREAATELFDSPLSLGNALGALRALAADLARLKANERYDIAPELVAALKAAVHVRTEKERGNAAKTGQLISVYFEQNTFENITDNARKGIDLGAAEILAGLFVDRRRGTSLARVLNAYISEVEAANGIDGLEQGLFGEQDWGAKSDLMKRARDKVIDEARYSLDLPPSQFDEAEVRRISEEYDTKLTPEETAKYQEWRARLPKPLQNEYDYDLKGLWKSNPNAKPSENLHFPDDFKKPTHITFSKQSRYSDADHEGGEWRKENGQWVFYASAFNLRMHGAEEMRRYFAEYEKDARLVLPKTGLFTDLRFSLGSPEEAFPATEAERAEIERSAKAKGTWLKAPNGQDTKLTPKQWVTVRTAAFKKWFGDWEKRARIQKLIDAPSISLSEYAGQYELTRDSARSWIKNNIEGKSFTIDDTGDVVRIGKVGRKKVTSHGYENDVHLKSIASIPAMLKNATFIDESPKEKTGARYRSFRYYVVGVKMDGVDYTAKLVVGVASDGSLYYDHSLTQIEKGVLSSLALENQPRTQDHQNAPDGIKDTRLFSLLQAQSSLVVDENGEPLAVWHGSPSDFNEFSLRYLGTNGTAEGYGFYFTDRRAVAESYARGTEAQRHQGANGRLFEVFLNIAKPLSNERVTMTREEFRRFLRELSRQTDADGNPLELLSNYGDAAYEGENAVMREAERLEYDGNDNDVDIVHSIINAVGDKERVFRVLRSTTGFDGIVADNPKWGGDQTVYVAFSPTQIKSATENVGTFDAGNPDIRYSLSMAEQAAWDEVLDAYEAGRLSSRNSHTVLNRTPVVLARILSNDGKNPNLKIVIDRSILDKTTGKTPSKFTGEYHHISVKDLRGLLVNLDNPIAVFDSETIPGDKVVLTEIKDFETGENAVVALAIGTKRGYIAVNAVSSIHGRRASSLNKWLKNGKLRYCNTQKFPAAVGVRWGGYPQRAVPGGKSPQRSVSVGVQNPQAAAPSGNASLLTEDDFKDELGVVKVNEENRFSLSMMDDEAAEKVARERRRDGARKKSAKTAARTGSRWRQGQASDVDFSLSKFLIQN